jgi:sugar transferase (PEP-CTERM system associated)
MQLLFGGVTWRSALLVLMDHALIVLGVVAAVFVRQTDPAMFGWPLIFRAVLIASVLQLVLHYCDLYDLRSLRDRRDLIVGVLQALGAASAILALLYYWIPVLSIGRGVFFIAAVFILVLITTWRLGFEWLSARVGPAERLLIVGTSSAAVDLARELYSRRHELGVELVGFIDADESRVGAHVLNPGVVGSIKDIPRIVGERRVDRVVVSLADARGKFSMEKLLQMKLHDGVRFDHLASVYEEFTGKIAVENLRPSYLIFSTGFRKTRTLAAAKRTLDIVIASLGLLLTSPIMLIVAALVRFTSPGPALYHQKRVGQRGHVFTVHKFRSMRQDAEAKTGAVWAKAGADPRVTAIGRWLRRLRLDELPQFWNVLVGDMSFVGPRPERPEFVADLSQQIPFYGERHTVRPGITGWAQVRHRYGASVEDSMQKLQFDLFYIKRMSVAFDLFILLETIKTVLVRRGS